MSSRNALPLAVAALLAVAACAPKQEQTVAATPAFDVKDLSGTWDRYPQPTESGQDPSVVPRPEPIPPPPLKPEFLGAWEAEQKVIAAANAAGEPIATGYTHCIPDGMPAMMQAMFPMEVLVTPRQITFIQEAYNQVRRVYFNDTLLDLSKPVKVHCNGEEHEVEVPRRLSELVDLVYLGRCDPSRLFVNKMQFDLPEGTE